MIKIELVKFEAQDVITASVAVPEETEAVVEETEAVVEETEAACAHSNFGVEVNYPNANLTCSDCGAKGTSGFPVTSDSITWG